MPHDPRRVAALLLAAADLADPLQRAAFLDQECGDAGDLRRGLDELLAGSVGSAGRDALLATGFAPVSAVEETIAEVSAPTIAIERSPVRPATFTDPHEFGPALGSLIAERYILRREIGAGGMGTVYLAEQIAPVKRQVALKLIRAGMDTKGVLARFDTERQALAIMDHPHIARVLDAGTTQAGRPFFVMELVRGVPLTEFCDQRRLGLPQRLNLFRQICSAVQHAHQKGIIHRDLKPSNILVEEHDGQPVPKVIDFGLAKAINSLPLTEMTLLTAFGTITGTPLYMAPEQAQFNALDVDTRADIYALGVILYELLTGSTPIRRETFQRSALDEILRVVREEEPPTPSQRISSSEGLPSLSANRQIEPDRLGRFVRGELDWIVMKALAKERSRRYDSAIGLAHDIERFLNDEPVTAGPPTAGYRLQKFAARNRRTVVAVSLILLALVGGIVGTAFGLVEARSQAQEARRQGAVALAAAAEKEQARGAEANQRRQAERRLAQVEKVNEILGSIFKDLNPGNVEKEQKPLAAVLGERLDQATLQIEGESIGDPLAVARMQMTLGESQLGLGYPDKAVRLYTKARATFADRLGATDFQTLASMDELGRAYLAAGQPDQAIRLLDQTLIAQKAKLGPAHPRINTTRALLASAYQAAGQLDRSLPLLEETLAVDQAKLGPNDDLVFNGKNNLAGAYMAAGRLDRAVPLFEETLAAITAKSGPDHLGTIDVLNNLAGAYETGGQFDRALPLFERSLAVRKAKLGPDHPETLRAMNNLAGCYQKLGRLDLALPLMEETLAARKLRLGADHPDALRSLSNLATGYHDAGRLREALALFEEAFALYQTKFGPDHPDSLNALNNVAVTYQNVGQVDRAVPLLERSLDLTRAKLGPDHPDTLNSMNNLAVAYQAAGQLDRAIPIFEETLRLLRAKLGPDHPETLASLSNLASAYLEANQVDRALPLYIQSLDLHRAKFGPDHPRTLLAQSVLAKGYERSSQLDRAVALFEQTLTQWRAKVAPDHPDTLTTMNNLADCYRQQGRFDRALPLFEETLAIRRRKFAPDHPSTRSTLNNLAGAYQAAGQGEKAIPLLRELADLRKQRAGATDPEYLGFLATLGRSLLQQQQWSEAEAVLHEVLAARESKDPDAWTTFNTRSMLGGALLGQQKYAEAEPLLVGGFAGMKQRLAKIPPQANPRLAEALDRLIDLAAVTGKPDQAQTWRDEKAKIMAPPEPGQP